MTTHSALRGEYPVTGYGAYLPSPARQALPLVLGLGNAQLCDDGAGIQLTAQLKSEQGAGVAVFIDGGLMSLSLFPYIEATDSLLVINAVDLRQEPGAVSLFEGEEMDDFLGSPRPRTVHERGLIDLLEVARLRDCLPARRALLCIQPKRVDWGEVLSLPVYRALPEASLVAAALLERWKHA